VDYQPRPRIRPKKRARDRLKRWADAHPKWVFGFEDETWWSRFARPRLHTWSEAGQPLRLVEQAVVADDPDPKALACYGLLRMDTQQVWLRFVSGRPVSSITTQFLAWCCERLAAEGKEALLLAWDNASWHISREVRAWVAAHNRQVKQRGQGVRLIISGLPIKSPWLNNLEPHWVHGKRNVVVADSLLSAQQLAERVCAYFGCPYDVHLAIPQKLS